MESSGEIKRKEIFKKYNKNGVTKVLLIAGKNGLKAQKHLAQGNALGNIRK